MASAKTCWLLADALSRLGLLRFSLLHTSKHFYGNISKREGGRSSERRTLHFLHGTPVADAIRIAGLFRGRHCITECFIQHISAVPCHMASVQRDADV